jgi:D-alanine-D-alanine ligase-like ATP-grasp enzyme
MKEECIECGGSSVPHTLTFITVAIDDVVRPFFAPGPIVKSMARPLHFITAPLVVLFMKGCEKLGLAKRVKRPDNGTALLAQMLWQEADARGIPMYEWRLFNLPRNMFMATLPNGKTISFEGIPLLRNGIDRVWWMDDKAVLKKKFRKLGLPVARGGSYFTQGGALRAFRKLATTAIVKPHSGSASRHTTLHIKDEEELARAFRIARQVAPFAVVEEELKGPVFRATVVDGKFAALLRRDPPSVVGDGVHTITELIGEANKNPKRGGPYFSKLKIDDAARAELMWQDMTPESVPEAGKRVTLHQKVNWSLGGTTADATDGVHPDNIALWEESARVLNACITGIDFIMEDPTRSWKEQPLCGFLECNSMPFFDNHHLPFEGEPRNVAGRIWDMVIHPDSF